MPSCNGDRLSRQEAQQLQAKLPPDTQNLSLSADQPYLVTTDAPSDLGLSVISAQDVDLPWQAINNVVRLIVETCLYEAVRKHTGGNMTWHFPTADGESFSMTVSLVNHVATTMEGLGG
ncbi:MAG: hypothetical protein M1838_001760 [Thelocarpon superellum]|nr:MAG: hypothetical protein M1838_001760 [Thelocarpon superellum]